MNKDNISYAKKIIKLNSTKDINNLNEEPISNNNNISIIQNNTNNSTYNIPSPLLIKKNFKIDNIINNSSVFSSFNIKIYIIIMLVIMADGGESSVVSFLIPILEDQWNFNTLQKGFFGTCGAIGALLGGSIAGNWSDIKGRKPMFILGNLLASVFACLASFSNNIYQYAVCRITFGFGVGISITAASALTTEITSSKSRAWMLNVIWLFFPLGELYCSVIANFLLVNDNEIVLNSFNKIQNSSSLNFNNSSQYDSSIFSFDSTNFNNTINQNITNDVYIFNGINIKNLDKWRKLMLLVALPCILSTIVSFFVSESPRYLLNKEKYTQAFKIIDYINIANNKPILSEEDKHILIKEQIDINSRNYKSINAFDNYKQLFKDKYLYTTLLISGIYFVMATSWGGLSIIMPKVIGQKEKEKSIKYNTPEDKHKAYTTFIISAFLEIPCTLLASFLAEIKILGRKGALMLSFALCFIPCTLIVIHVHGFSVFLIITRFLTTIPFGIAYIYNNEVFPTNIRSTALGVLGGMSRISAISSPFIMFALLDIGFIYPFLFCSILFLMGIVLSFLLPLETIGKDIS